MSLVKRECKIMANESSKPETTIETQTKSAVELLEAGITTPENKNFESLAPLVSERTMTAIRGLGFAQMTDIQYKTILPILAGRDVLGAARTGSGKTLAFLIPALEALQKRRFRQKDGTGVIVLAPTRELALQTFCVMRELTRGLTQTIGAVIGGADRGKEANRLERGVNALVATPGRLLDHLQSTRGFETQRLFMLVIDEADRLLQQGFEREITQILNILPKARQTVLFSATLSQHVARLAKISLADDPVYVGVDDDKIAPTVDALKQGFILTPADRKLELLYTFIKKNANKKIMIFFSSCNSVQFHAELFNYIDTPVLEIHGKQKQSKRTSTFVQFTSAKSGVLFCTDVAARGLDIPEVDWIVQYDPPDDPDEYIHRVGRTARGTNQTGQAIMILMKEELAFVSYLKNRNIPITEFDFKKAKIMDIGDQIIELLEKNYHLNTAGKLAFKSYIQSYASHSNKDIFDVNKLDVSKICVSFGFKTPPYVNLDFSAKRVRDYRDKKNNQVGKAKKRYY